MGRMGWQFPSARAVRVLDIVIVVYVVVWAALGVAIGRDIAQQVDLADQVARVGATLRATGEGFEALSAIPFVGDDIGTVAERVVTAGTEVEASGRASADAIREMSVLVAIAVGLLPTLVLVPLYLPMRLAWRRDVAAVREALRARRADARPAARARPAGGRRAPVRPAARRRARPLGRAGTRRRRRAGRGRARAPRARRRRSDDRRRDRPEREGVLMPARPAGPAAVGLGWTVWLPRGRAARPRDHRPRILPRIFFTALLAAAAALVSFGLPATVLAKSYSMPEVTIEATVRPGGDMVVRETRRSSTSTATSASSTGTSRGPGRRASRCARVSGPEGEYARTDDPASRPPQTWWAAGEGGGDVRLEVYFRQVDALVPVTIEYVVRDAATKWDDTAELYWKFIGDDWDHGVGSVDIRITLPPGVGAG